MEFKEYQKSAERTATKRNFVDTLTEGVLGLTGESGEVSDLIKKSFFQGHEMDKSKVIEELGDVLWYVARIASAFNINLDMVAENNIAKLMKRYPEGFSSERSINRGE